MSKSPRTISAYAAADRLYSDSKSRHLRRLKVESDQHEKSRRSAESFKALKTSKFYLLRGRYKKTSTEPTIAETLSERSAGYSMAGEHSELEISQSEVITLSPVVSVEPSHLQDGVSSRALSPIERHTSTPASPSGNAVEVSAQLVASPAQPINVTAELVPTPVVKTRFNERPDTLERHRGTPPIPDPSPRPRRGRIAWSRLFSTIADEVR